MCGSAADSLTLDSDNLRRLRTKPSAPAWGRRAACWRGGTTPASLSCCKGGPLFQRT